MTQDLIEEGVTKMFEIKKVVNAPYFPSIKIEKSTDVAQFARQFYSCDLEIYESMYALFCNRGNKTIGYAKISQGGVNGTICDFRLILKYAVELLASGIILIHNHPSGNRTPSTQDKALTNRIRSGLRALDMELLDHIILTPDSHFSFADNDLMVFEPVSLF
jgi:DNA repair protein RadC